MHNDDCFACRHCDTPPIIYQIGALYTAQCPCGQSATGDSPAKAAENWNNASVSRMPLGVVAALLICIGLAAIFA